MLYEVKRIPPGPVIKVVFFVFLVVGFIVGMFYGLLIMNLFSTMVDVLDIQDEILREYSGFGLFGLIIMGLISALFTSVIMTAMVGLSVVCYNVFAGMLGGVKLELGEEARRLHQSVYADPAAGISPGITGQPTVEMGDD